jgi:hypothetical protein
MTYQEKLLSEFTVDELERELVAGGMQIPGEQQFKNQEKTGDRQNFLLFPMLEEPPCMNLFPLGFKYEGKVREGKMERKKMDAAPSPPPRTSRWWIWD